MDNEQFFLDSKCAGELSSGSRGSLSAIDLRDEDEVKTQF
jgi:hypothetical protein